MLQLRKVGWMIEGLFVYSTCIALIVFASDEKPLSNFAKVWIGIAVLYALIKIRQIANDNYVNFSNDVPLGALHKYAVGRIEAILINILLFFFCALYPIVYFLAKWKR